MALTTEFSAALNQVCSERGLEPEDVLEGIRQALVSAYRKDHPGVPFAELRAEVNAETGEMKVFHNGEDVTPSGFGRIAAQTAKQVIMQQVREAEKDALRKKYKGMIGELVSGHIFKVQGGSSIVDLGRAQGILPPHEQVEGESYRTGQRIKVLIKDVQEGTRGPQVILSRADPRFVAALFEIEVPEITAGKVVIESVAREAGSRTKIAVSTTEEGLDPVGSCVGQKGSRVREVMRELGPEKIDIIPYSDDPATLVANALSPATVKSVTLDANERKACAIVADDQLSLAIGKGGQNVRLAAKLSGWRIDIKGETTKLGSLEEAAAHIEAQDSSLQEKAPSGEESSLFDRLSSRTRNALVKAGYSSLESLRELSEADLAEIKGIGPKAVAEIKQLLE